MPVHAAIGSAMLHVPGLGHAVTVRVCGCSDQVAVRLQCLVPALQIDAGRRQLNVYFPRDAGTQEKLVKDALQLLVPGLGVLDVPPPGAGRRRPNWPSNRRDALRRP